MKPATRRRLTRGVRAGGQAVLATALIGGVVWAAGQSVVLERVETVDITREGHEPAVSESMTVALERAVLSCPGPELLGLSGARDLVLTTLGTAVAAPLADLPDLPLPAGAPALTFSSGAAPDDDPAEEDPASDDAASGGDAEPVLAAALDDPTGWFAIASGAAAPGFVATQETRAATDEAVGLATIPCQRSGPEAWILGGGGGPGRAERLVLMNPGSNPVTVDITAHGATGPSSPPDGQGVVVPAQGRTVLLGDALAPDEETPAFAVTATGGDVSAALVEAALDGTRPIGFDVVAPAAPPDQTQVIPGVLIPDEGQGTVHLRIVNPGETEVIATVSALTATGEVPLPDAVARIAPGAVADVPLEGVPEGITSLVVNSDAPVVSAARTVVDDGGADGPADAAWAGSQSPLVELAGAAVTERDGLRRLLVLAATGSGAAVEVIQGSNADSRTSEVLVPTNGTVVSPLAGDGVWVRQTSGSGELFAAVVTTGAGDTPPAVSSMPLTIPPTDARRSEVVPLP